jgi:sodium-dependent dicarboxylate transporter 2/3/5
MSGLSGLMTNFMSDAGTTALLGPIVIPMGIMTGVQGEPWAVGLAVAFATSFAHFLIVGTPNNAIVYGLGIYPASPHGFREIRLCALGPLYGRGLGSRIHGSL